MLLRPASFFAAAGGRASYAGPIIYALACHAIAVLFAGAHDTICDQDQCNDATVFRIPEEQERYEYGSPEYEALGDISARISEGLEERQASRDEAADRASQLLDQWSKMQEEYYRAFNEVYGVG